MELAVHAAQDDLQSHLQANEVGSAQGEDVLNAQRGRCSRRGKRAFVLDWSGRIAVADPALLSS